MVQAALDAVRPVTVEVIVLASIPGPLNITGLTITPDTPQIRAVIEAEIIDLITREEVSGGTMLTSYIREAISLAVGEDDYVLTRPGCNISRRDGEITVPGRFPWSG